MDDITRHYASGYEQDRLNSGSGKLENERTREFFTRFLPSPPATILDIGGGPGAHACWLAKQAYTVHLIDLTPLHVELAKEASSRQREAPLASVNVGDACALAWESESFDAVLLFGPLYHLTGRDDRIAALREAHRVLKSGGVLLAAGISRFASTMDGIRQGFLKDPHFMEIVSRDLKEGQHRNPTRHPHYFMDTFFHHPEELRGEVVEAGFDLKGVFGLEGPGWLVHDFDEWWERPDYRNRLLDIARILEAEPTLLGLSAHLIAVASR